MFLAHLKLDFSSSLFMPSFHEYREKYALNKNEIQEKWHFK